MAQPIRNGMNGRTDGQTNEREKDSGSESELWNTVQIVQPKCQ